MLAQGLRKGSTEMSEQMFFIKSRSLRNNEVLIVELQRDNKIIHNNKMLTVCNAYALEHQI